MTRTKKLEQLDRYLPPAPEGPKLKPGAMLGKLKALAAATGGEG